MKDKDCRPDKIISKIQHLLENIKKSHELYPKSLKVVAQSSRDTPLGKSNGGWGDIRDHSLCLNFTQPQAEENFKCVKFIHT